MFDTGATHSVIASAHASSLGLSFETLCGGLVVASPMVGAMVACEVCRSCVVRIVGQELTADLVGCFVYFLRDWGRFISSKDSEGVFLLLFVLAVLLVVVNLVALIVIFSFFS